MENAADALKMAAAVLIFVLALSISINAFGEVRQASKTILDYRDREYDYTYVTESSNTTRTVSGETIVPSIYKAYKENYKIVFNGLDSGEYIYQKKDTTSSTERKEICSIDLEKEVLGNDTQKEKFIKAILYGNKSATDGETWDDIYQEFQNMGIYLKSKGLYDIINSSNFKEELGVYYQEEVQGDSQAPNANKTKKRVITYTKLKKIPANVL